MSAHFLEWYAGKADFMNLYGVLLVLVVGAGVLLVSSIFLSRREDPANILLTALVACIAYACAARSAWQTGLQDFVPWFFSIPVPIAYWVGPFLYLYIHETLFVESKHWIFHFIPGFLVWGLVFRYEYGGRPALEEYFRSHDLAGLRFGLNTGGMLHWGGYVLISWKTLRNRWKGGNTEDFRLSWLRFLLSTLSALWVTYLAALVCLPISPRLADVIVYSGCCLALYALGLFLLRRGVALQAAPAMASSPAADAGEAPRYATSNLTPEVARVRAEALVEHLKTTGNYRNPNFKLGDLARELKTTPYKTSQILNTGLGENFYNLINRLRVEEVRARLSDPGCDAAIIDIAYEVGFNSKSAFNRAFRQITGKTPSEYRADNVKKS